MERYEYLSLRGELKALKKFIANLGIGALTGDVTAGPGSGSQSATIANGAVTNAKMADMAQARIKGRASGAGTGPPQDLTGTQATVILDVMVGANGSPGTKGLVPAPSAGDAAAGKFLKADATWAAPSGTGAPADADYLVKTANAGLSAERVVTDNTDITADWSVAGVVKFLLGAFTGDISKSAGSLSTAIVNNAVTDAALRDSAATSVIGRSANSTGDPADIATSTDGQVLRRSGGTLGFGALDLADSDAVTNDLPITNLAARRASVSISFDNGGTEIADNTKARWRVPNGVTATLIRWSIAADVGGAIVIDIYKDTWANYPPASGDSIKGSGTPPTITATNTNAESTSFTGWTTTTFSGGDSVIFNVDSCTTITACDLELEFDVIQ